MISHSNSNEINTVIMLPIRAPQFRGKKLQPYAGAA